MTKLHADILTDADYICHVDSDCIFCRPITPGDLIIDGRPVVVTRPYALLGRHWPWRRPTEEFLGWPVSHDFMQRPPFTFPRWLYAEVREHAVTAHGVTLERYVLTRPARGFSEFNVLSGFASALYPDRFIWIDASVADAGTPICHWFWSWSGLDAATRNEILATLPPHNGTAE